MDNDVSAYSGKPRKDYNRMLDDVRGQRITAIGAWHTDRLHRSMSELEEYIDTCHPGRSHSHSQGRRDRPVHGGRPDECPHPRRRRPARVRTQGERIQAKHIEPAAAGKSTGGGHRPFGYQRIYDRPNGRTRSCGEDLVPEETEHIREAAQRILAGEGLFTVAADFYQRGIFTVTGKPFSTSTLARVLASARIAGYREHRPRSRSDTRRVRTGEITAKGNWPAIISLEDSQRLRALLTDPARRTSPGRTGRHLCSGGVLNCGLCGHRMARRSRGNGKSLYLCDGSPGRPGCGHCYIDEDGTDAVVTRWVAGSLSDPAFHKALRQRGDGVPDEKMLLDDIRAAENSRSSAPATGRRTDQPPRMAGRQFRSGRADHPRPQPAGARQQRPRPRGRAHRARRAARVPARPGRPGSSPPGRHTRSAGKGDRPAGGEAGPVPVRPVPAGATVGGMKDAPCGQIRACEGRNTRTSGAANLTAPRGCTSLSSVYATRVEAAIIAGGIGVVTLIGTLAA